MARRNIQIQHRAPLWMEMINPPYRVNARHAGVWNKSSGCMAMASVRTVIQMLCRVVMGLFVKICHSVFLSWPWVKI